MLPDDNKPVPTFLPASSIGARAAGEILYEFDSTADAARTGFKEGKTTIEAELVRCCHCGGLFPVTKGSGIRRGFCTRHAAPHCGGPNCWSCPTAQKVFGRGAARRRRRMQQ